MSEDYEKQKQRMRRTPISIQAANRVVAKDLAIAKCQCNTCGGWVWFDTNGNGGIVALDYGSRRLHRHQECVTGPPLPCAAPS